VKRQREQARRERAQAKVEKRQQRKDDKASGIGDDDIFEAPVAEEPIIAAK
jgi:hypothetical protein